MTDLPPLTCNAATGRKPGAYGFEFTFCQTTRGLRHYWSLGLTTSHFVSFCGATGHEANVRRRFPEGALPQPVDYTDPSWPGTILVEHDLMEWPGDLPDHPADATFADKDPIDVAKWERDRMESWTVADDMSVSVGLDYMRTEA